jgi:hypothetical protein
MARAQSNPCASISIVPRKPAWYTDSFGLIYLSSFVSVTAKKVRLLVHLKDQSLSTCQLRKLASISEYDHIRAVNALYSVVFVSYEMQAEDGKVGCRYERKYKFAIITCNKTQTNA